MEQKRFPIVDEIRGLAIVLMIFFHFSFDLNLFNFVKIDFSNNPFWYLLPRIIVFLFLFSVGLSLGIGHRDQIKWKKFWQRLIKIVLFALIISLSTFLIYPDKWIYFGTLHCIALCSLWALPFLRLPSLCLLIFLGLFIPSIFLDWNIPWFEMDHYSLDYISPFPWFGAVTLGIFLFHKNFHHLTLPVNPIFKFLGFLGRNALIIYLVHQPLMFSLIWLFSKIIQVS
jgi:uncharacterized membrane protein